MAREVVKKVKNAILYSDGCIKVENVICSYPHLDKPWAKKDTDKKKYSITGLGPKETHEEAKKLIVEEINKLLTSSKIGKLAGEHKFFRDGDNTAKTENEGRWVVKASENADRAPTLRNRAAIKLTPEDGLKVFYPGCVVNILIRPWAQNNEHGKKINANLISVQFVGDGERLGEAALDDDDVFDPLEGSDDDEGDGLDSSGLDDDDDM